MRYGILSDIHGNLEALQAVLKACRQQNVDGILCAGDIVGYGANPAQCIAVLEEAEAVCVAGNHDWAVGARLDASYFLEDAKEAINWTRGQLSVGDITLLNALGSECHNDDLTFVHGSPDRPEAFRYLTNAEKAAAAFEAMKRPVCFIGHTHVPQVYVQRGDGVIGVNSVEFEVSPEYKYIVNVGSVGQPRDGNPMASFGIYDSGAQTIELRRVPYNIRLVQKKIIEAGLPPFLAERLSHGR